MKQQIIFLEGGIAKENYKNFMESVEQFEYDPYAVKEKKWKKTLQKDLGDGYEVLFIPFFNRDFCDYAEWKCMFEKVFPYLKDNPIFLGHSLGGSFLVKYFNEQQISFDFRKILLLAPAFKDSAEELLGSFHFDKKLENLRKYSNKIIILQSRDDTCVSYEDFEDFQRALPDAEYISFEDKGHFILPEFPELLDIIKKL